MATIKSYTNLEQSKKLAEILPLESADMFLAMNGTLPVMSKYIDDGLVTADDTAIPCWSVGALLELMPPCVRISKNCDGNYDLGYRNFDTKEYLYMIDACCELILRLHELKML